MRHIRSLFRMMTLGVLVGLFHVQVCAAGRSVCENETGLPRETHWLVPTTLGYSLGTAAIFFVASENDWINNQATTTGVIFAALFGTIMGYRIGSSADDHLARGLCLSPAHRFGVRLGTVLAFVPVGLLGSLLYINNSNSNYQGGISDEEAMARGLLYGAAFGGLIQVLVDSKLWPIEYRLGMEPVDSGVALALRSRF